MARLERRIGEDKTGLDGSYFYGGEAMTLKWDDGARGLSALTIDCPDNTYLEFFAMSRPQAYELLKFLEICFAEEG